MDAATTRQVLSETNAKSNAVEDVEDWLKVSEIDEPEFQGWLKSITVHTQEVRPHLSQGDIAMLIGMGFELGWTAHEVMLATPVEAGPAPDLSESLE